MHMTMQCGTHPARDWNFEGQLLCPVAAPAGCRAARAPSVEILFVLCSILGMSRSLCIASGHHVALTLSLEGYEQVYGVCTQPQVGHVLCFPFPCKSAFCHIPRVCAHGVLQMISSLRLGWVGIPCEHSKTHSVAPEGCLQIYSA